MNSQPLIIEDHELIRDSTKQIGNQTTNRCSRRIVYITLFCALFVIGLTLIFVLVTVLRKGQHNHSNTQSTYRAAAAQYYPILNVVNPNLTITKNLALYEQIINEAAHANVDIIVFPEGSLGDITAGDRRSLVNYCEIIQYPFSRHDSQSNDHQSGYDVAPCQDPAYNHSSNLQVKTLSCLAQKYKQALTINQCIRETCTPGLFNQSIYHFSASSCPSDGQYLWSTNVVYGPDGHIGAMYAKTHLFDSKSFDAASEDQPIEQSIYHSDFGVTFGTIICFDIEFRLPLSRVLESGVSHLLFTSWWAINQAPQLTSSMLQASVAHKRSINVIAANSLTQRAQGGGIYHAGINQTIHFDPFIAPKQGQYSLVIADLPTTMSSDSSAQSDDPSDDTSTVTDIPSIPPSSSIPCVVSAISEEGNCAFLKSDTQASKPNITPFLSRQQFNVSHDGIQCLVDLLPSNNQSNHLSEYAVFASSSVYSTPNTPAELFMESCFVMRCVDQSNEQADHAMTISQTSKQCSVSYNSSAMFDDIRLFAGFNCSRFDNPSKSSIDQSSAQPVNGTVLPMFATGIATAESASAFHYRFVGRADGLCWWSMSTTHAMTKPLFSFGFYAIDGEE